MGTSANPLVRATTYEVVSVDNTATDFAAADDLIAASSADLANAAAVVAGARFTTIDGAAGDVANVGNASGIVIKQISETDMLTKDIEAVQAKINTARVQAGSQYAAIESAVSYTTDLTAQYELGYNTVNDVNFSMETAHLAKNQILQQAATAMLAQANQGQQGLLQLIQV